MCRSILEGGRRCPHDETPDVRRARQRAAYQAKRATPTGTPPSAGTPRVDTAAAIRAASESLRLANQTGLGSDSYKAAEQACVDAGAAIDTAAWAATVANPELRASITDCFGATATASTEAFHAAFDAAWRQARLDQAEAWAVYVAAETDQDTVYPKVLETRESVAHLNRLRDEIRDAIREATLAELATATGGLGAQLPAGTVVSKQLRDETATTLASMPSTLTEAFAAHPSELRIESSPHRAHYQSNAVRRQAAGWAEPHPWQSSFRGDTAEEAIDAARRFNKKHNRTHRTVDDYTAEPNGAGEWRVTCRMATRVYETKRFSRIRARTVSSLTHELIHRAEHGDRTIGRVQHAHLTARVGDTAADYASLRLASGSNEWAVDDHFADPYSGRRYGGDTTHFEVLSTGVQQILPENGSGHLFGDQHDPRLRCFTLGWLAAYQPPTPKEPQ